MKAVDLYNDAIRIKKTGRFQRRIFEHWSHRRHYNYCDVLGFDTETTGVTFGAPSFLHISEHTDIKVHDVTIFGISLCIPYKERLALVWGRIGTSLFDACTKLLSTKGPKVAQNARFDMRVCEHNGISIGGKIDCTLTEARIVWNRRNNFKLQALSEIICPELSDWELEVKRLSRNLKSSYTRAGYPKDYVNYSFIPDDVMGPYSMIDSFMCWILYMRLHPDILANYLKLYSRERRIIRVIIKIEDRGMQFDRNRAKREGAKLITKSKGQLKKLIQMAGKEFNPRSYKQLLPVLLDVGIPKRLLMKPKEAKLTTEKDTLEAAVKKIRKSKPKKFVNTLLNMRSCDKLANTYLRPLRNRARYNNGIIYGSINPCDTVTGRMAHSNPNLGNIPRPTSGFEKYNPVRKCFVCRAGYTNLFADYSQMEMWLFAILAGATELLGRLKDGGDAHSATAIMMRGDKAVDKKGVIIPEIRQLFKQVNFGIIYGMGAEGLADYISISVAEAYDLRDEYLENLPEVGIFMDTCKQDLINKGYVEGIFGHRYHIPVRQAYKAVNALVQGDCAQILKIALLRLDEFFVEWPFSGLEPYLLTPLHDEEMMEISSRVLGSKSNRQFIAKNIHDRMEIINELRPFGVERLKIDIKVSTKSWEDKKPWKVA